ncbi:four helix bundle protein [Aggregatimonas sangjinii]|uniref:Four helix bundle protein n=1 Tax=Aggregatimonas sangjinii TaxID=2583587 RepID=A0A5B7SMS6_9FLAO|nr:four helix bundle protein [Aggregatimonas sangjinii]QCW99865.1 four helix bundle protein [Aggregatimonas sangjinii]
MRNFRNYKVWEQGHAITLAVYKETQRFPKSEEFGLKGQMRRAAYSIPSNIAEGCGRESDAEFKRFLIISQGSASELEYFLILSRDLEYIDEATYQEMDNEVNKTKRSINNLVNKV